MWQAHQGSRVVVQSWVRDESDPDASRPEFVQFRLVDDLANEAVVEAYIDGDVARLRGLSIHGLRLDEDPKAMTSLARQLPGLLAKVAQSAQFVTQDASATEGTDRRTRTKLTDKFLGEVADVYRANDGIVDAVRRHFDLSQRTAYRYVTAAKDRGFITEEDR